MPPFHADEAQPNAVDGCTYEITRDAKGEVTISQLPAPRALGGPSRVAPLATFGGGSTRRARRWAAGTTTVRSTTRCAAATAVTDARSARFEPRPRRDGGRGASARPVRGGAARALLSPAAGPRRRVADAAPTLRTARARPARHAPTSPACSARPAARRRSRRARRSRARRGVADLDAHDRAHERLPDRSGAQAAYRDDDDFL